MQLINSTMTNEQKLDTLFQVLTNAYMEGHLRPGQPCGCLIGNLIAKACGYTYEDNGGLLSWVEDSPMWTYKFTTLLKDIPRIDMTKLNNFEVVRMNDTFIQRSKRRSVDKFIIDWADNQLQEIGLSEPMLMELEWLFENHSTKGATMEERMFNGLNAALEYLSREFGIEDKVEEKRKNLSSVFRLDYDNLQRVKDTTQTLLQGCTST